MVAEQLLPLLAAGTALLLAAGAEAWHARRVRRLAVLAFGPTRRPAPWARAAPPLRVLALTALAFGLSTLLCLEPRRYSTSTSSKLDPKDVHHVLIVLDVSPSMRLVDAGPQQNLSRMQRARALIESYFDRVPSDNLRVSVIAVYNGAKPVVIDTRDFEVVRNIFGDLPMHYAFKAGKTKLFDGLLEAARIAKPWNPGSTTLLVISDGDTLPATGMPKLPPSIHSTLVVGVGDPRVGKFIDGRQSRQDIPTLKQMAARLGGSFHDGNELHLSSSLIAATAGLESESLFEQLTRRDYALIATLLGALCLALLPLLLHFFGTAWRPGATARTSGTRGQSPLAQQPKRVLLA